MTNRSVSRRLAAGALAGASIGGALLGLAGTASASPVPNVPLTTTDLCTSGGGEVTAAGTHCTGGNDDGDAIISDEAAALLVRAVPRPDADG